MSVLIAGFAIDATATQDHTLDSEVTDHPVESGSDITDNVRAQPITVALDCIVSNTPIGLVASQRDPATAPGDDAYAKLLEIRDAREPVVIETERQRYENMVLQSLTIPIAADTGDSLRFRATFKQIRIVTNSRTTTKVAVPRAKKKKNRGAQKPKAVVLPPGLTPTSDEQVSSGYKDSFMGRSTDALGVTDGPAVGIDSEIQSPEDRALDATSKW